ncbi:PIG-L deacetylase family protein [Salibacter halophilus]|uniref:PIG-L family deacetylase n=1 Tax=Salibacter halophilus TaxID=1803916 RepID=A0A6N6M2Y0_9FLAO|nr:PIG-L deacetylase family protein [Salibacter halophilus]KAB1063552.1 PIG-L family deacetylase [Salibacter halophilus]
MKNILVVAPHCDDEVLGCGGTIKKLTKKGLNVIVLMITNGFIGAPELFKEEDTLKNRQEAKVANAYLGVKKVVFLDFPAPRLDSIASYKLSIAISEIIRDYDIDTMYIPHKGDIHRDHFVTHECSLVAARPINNCPVKRIYSYETLSETEWAMPSQNEAFIPTVFENVTDTFEEKAKSFGFYKSQVKEYPHPRSQESMRALAMHRGATVGFHLAEAFMLIREIKD